MSQIQPMAPQIRTCTSVCLASQMQLCECICTVTMLHGAHTARGCASYGVCVITHPADCRSFYRERSRRNVFSIRTDTPSYKDTSLYCCAIHAVIQTRSADAEMCTCPACHVARRLCWAGLTQEIKSSQVVTGHYVRLQC